MHSFAASDATVTHGNLGAIYKEKQRADYDTTFAFFALKYFCFFCLQLLFMLGITFGSWLAM